MVIEVKNLEFSWRAETPTVLSIDSLTVNAGECLFIKGQSGSGKSTLLSLLAGVTQAPQGTVKVMGQNLGALSNVQRDHFRADHMGYIFQMFNLIPYLSVVENVLLPCRFSARRRDQAVARSGGLESEAQRLLKRLDLDHDELLQRSVSTMSVGQQQRVAAARALMGSPELLIADEPTSALDSNRREAFIRLLFDECRETGATLVFVSHDAALEPLFDRSLDLAQLNRAERLPQEV